MGWLKQKNKGIPKDTKQMLIHVFNASLKHPVFKRREMLPGCFAAPTVRWFFTTDFPM
jgi:hypothetical protein